MQNKHTHTKVDAFHKANVLRDFPANDLTSCYWAERDVNLTHIVPGWDQNPETSRGFKSRTGRLMITRFAEFFTQVKKSCVKLSTLIIIIIINAFPRSLTRHGTESVALLSVKVIRRPAPLHAVPAPIGRALGVVSPVIQERKVAQSAERVSTSGCDRN